MSTIQVLDFKLANLIAAGEVVDRPASVVKELLENAMDAGATSITAEIRRGGIALIRVTDNGCGMSQEDLPIAIRRHATSKIREAGDLDNIQTLGFRGEALAAIAAVSTLRILTKRRQDECGTLLEAEGGEGVELSPVGCQDGTTVLVEELFHNVPARRKFMKSDIAEANAVTAVVEKMALSRPNVSIQYICEGTTRFRTVGDGDLLHVIHAVLGKEFSKKLTVVNGFTEGLEVHGYVGTPDCVRGNRNYQNFFINGRYVKSRTAMAALEQAFDSYIPSEKFPVCVLELSLHPTLVDVNVHPAKLEVKFSNERAVFDAIYCAVRNALMQNLERPELRLGNASSMSADDLHVLNPFVPLYDKMAQDAPGEELVKQLSLTDLAAPEGEPPSSPMPSVQTELPASQPLPKFPLAEAPNGLVDLPSKQLTPVPKEPPFFAPAADLPLTWIGGVGEAVLQTQPLEQSAAAMPTEGMPPHVDPTLPKPSTAEPVVCTPAPPDTPAEPTEMLPMRKHKPIPTYRILGEAFHSYILAELEDRILVIDKHAAHERILFEKMKENRRRSEKFSQDMLVPMVIPVSSEEIAALHDYRSSICEVGFDYSVDPAAHAASLFQIPGGLSISEASTLFSELATKLADSTGNVAVSRDIAYEKALYQASCKAAVKAGRIYDEAHLKWICDEMLSLDDIKYCPHGRPVAFELTRHELEHQFLRA